MPISTCFFPTGSSGILAPFPDPVDPEKFHIYVPIRTYTKKRPMAHLSITTIVGNVSICGASNKFRVNLWACPRFLLSMEVWSVIRSSITWSNVNLGLNLSPKHLNWRRTQRRRVEKAAREAASDVFRVQGCWVAHSTSAKQFSEWLSLG